MFGLGDRNSTRASASFVTKEGTYVVSYKKREADVAVLLKPGEVVDTDGASHICPL